MPALLYGNIVLSMKSRTHGLGTDAAAAHRRELESELQTRNERRARADVFGDLRRRNERRTSLAKPLPNRLSENRSVVTPTARYRVSPRSS